MEEISNLRKLQLEELKILKMFKKICEENDLRYYLLGGTLLGAVRHDGFIPWDDDVDVCMPREDYEKFQKIADVQLEKPYYLRSLENNNDYRYCFARIATENMKIKNSSANIPRIEDVWIDIIPLDGMPAGKAKNFFHKAHMYFWRSMNQIGQYDEIVDQKRKRGKIEALLVKIAGWKIWRNMADYRKCTRKIQKVLKKYKYDDCDTIINYMAAYGFDETFQKNWFGKGREYSFEDDSFVGPDDHDKVLRQIYGSDYMQLPPEDQRNKHNAEIIKI